MKTGSESDLAHELQIVDHWPMPIVYKIIEDKKSALLFFVNNIRFDNND